MSVLERRIDPVDANAYTFNEIFGYYRKRYDEAQIKAYWSTLHVACSVASSQTGHLVPNEQRVQTAHSYTGRMCAASRWEESKRPDCLFYEPQARKLAGSEGLAHPMGDWIMVRRTRFGDDLLRHHYAKKGVRQLVVLGAGFDARAYRLDGLEQLHVFEVDQQTTFDVKEPLLVDESLCVAGRHVVATDFTQRGAWARDLEANGFCSSMPTVWLLEGLLMYLSLDDTKTIMGEIGRLSAPGSLVFHDACSASQVVDGRAPIVGGARFIGGSDDYGSMWRNQAGFSKTYVYNLDSIRVDRHNRRLVVDYEYPEATESQCRGRILVLFVTAEN